MRRADKIRELENVPLFAGFNKKQLGEVAKHADTVDVPAWTTLTQEGSVGRQFGVIVAGSARVSRNGRKLAELGPGDFFGEMALLLHEPSSATVTTSSETTMLVMHGREFNALLDDVPALAKKLATGLAARLLEADAKLVH
jgi:CRP/FNR family transcriptional regulator, cyclic AMP receptor protein